MLCVKTKLGPSPIAGIGLFADQLISAGTVVWEFTPGIDLLLSKEDIEKLSLIGQEQIHRYSYVDSDMDNKYVFCGDDARFFNHADDPNCDDTPPSKVTTAVRDIQPGEELTCNYKIFYGNIEEHPEIA